MNISVFDFEALNWNELYAVGYYDGKNFDYYYADEPNTMEVVSALFQILEKHKVDNKTSLYAHNGGKYDFLPVMKYCLLADIPFSPKIVSNGRVLNLVIQAEYTNKGRKAKNPISLYNMKDSYVLLPSSFAKLCSAFDVQHKKIEGEDYSKYVSLEYLKNDCIGMHEVLTKFHKEYQSNFTKKVNLPLTISSGAMTIYQDLFNCKNKHNLFQLSDNHENLVRQSYYGGRTEIFKMLYEGRDPLNYYDVNSLYPSVMKHNEYPVGDYSKSKIYVPSDDLLGIFKIKWKAPNIYIPLLPVRHENKLLFPVGKGEGWYTNVEIDKAIELGYEVEMLDGFVWEEKKKIFGEYVDMWYEVKKNSKGAKKQLAKLMLNSLYGKFGMRRERINVVCGKQLEEESLNGNILDYLDEDYLFGCIPKKLTNCNYILPHLASFITSYSRLLMYKYIDKCNQNIWYMDTDSLLTTETLPCSSELGDMKKEYSIAKAYFLLPKTYAIELTDPLENGEKEVIKLKGFRPPANDHNKKNKYATVGIKDFASAVKNGEYENFYERIESVLGFKESLRRKMGLFATDIKEKRIRVRYNKRTILENYDTEPITL